MFQALKRQMIVEIRGLDIFPLIDEGSSITRPVLREIWNLDKNANQVQTVETADLEGAEEKGFPTHQNDTRPLIGEQ